MDDEGGPRPTDWLRQQMRKASKDISTWPSWMKRALNEERAARGQPPYVEVETIAMLDLSVDDWYELAKVSDQRRALFGGSDEISQAWVRRRDYCESQAKRMAMEMEGGPNAAPRRIGA